MRFMQGLRVRIRAVLWWAKLQFFVNSKNVKFESRCSILKGARVRATDGGSANFGTGVSIDRYADVTVKYGELIVGPGTYIGQFSVICARKKIIIGKDCLIAEHVTIRDQDHRFGPGLLTKDAGFTSSPVEIGDNVWIGAKVTITKGVTIGDHSVIGANSVVTKKIPPKAIAVGSPAKVIRFRDV
ncbi:MAG: acyltransferase [Sedimentisphaerales bacterium]|nr:acyltransferase [Sedimentisphaerales bacterium]